MLTARSRITKILMAGIAHHKQKCLIFIMVPLKKEENVPSQRQKKLHWIKFKRRSLEKSKKKNNSNSIDNSNNNSNN